MSEEKTITLLCKGCGRTIEIPEELDSFACMYCGEKMTMADFAAADNDYAERVAFCLLEHRDLRAAFGKTSYEELFTDYARQCRAPFDRLNAFILTNPASRDGVLRRTAERFMDDVEDAWQRDKRWPSHMKRDNMIDEDRFVIAVYMMPMILHLGLQCSEPVANAIRDEWLRRYPKYPFYIGNFEEINGGFRKKFLGLCFITTAVCEAEGKADNCRELTVLRGFRDGYLAAQPDGPALIAEYYEKAPVIVTLIDLLGDREKRYAAIRDEYILPCVEDAEAGRNERCRDRYVTMMRRLEKQYLAIG